ncbi:MAG TPA: crosslink repair DNA glycosylase YcaQ family protein, partial [Anaerolineales bacterium]|nr:crosslink repair DNA glycosylase YcaQ family protein [Anaerolineales bacterium]
MTDIIYELPALRALALHTQGLDRLNGGDRPVNREAIYQMVERLGCIQIDSLQMVRRSHYLVLWSRLGNYAVDELDRLAYGPGERGLFEGWQHAACLIPLSQYRYQLPHMRYIKDLTNEKSSGWLAEPGSRELIQHALERIRQEGGLRASDFAYDGP